VFSQWIFANNTKIDSHSGCGRLQQRYCPLVDLTSGGNYPYTQVVHDQMEDGQCLLEWYATTLVWARLISGGSVGQLWNGRWMIMTRISFTFPISLPRQCSSSPLNSSSGHIEIMINNTMLFFYDAHFIWIEFIGYTWRGLHREWGAVITIFS
jgi:hypothetical protein